MESFLVEGCKQDSSLPNYQTLRWSEQITIGAREKPLRENLGGLNEQIVWTAGLSARSAARGSRHIRSAATQPALVAAK
jgi:hypothetical protein